MTLKLILPKFYHHQNTNLQYQYLRMVVVSMGIRLPQMRYRPEESLARQPTQLILGRRPGQSSTQREQTSNVLTVTTPKDWTRTDSGPQLDHSHTHRGSSKQELDNSLLD